MNQRRLSIYLNDRLSILTAGSELAARTRSSNEGTAYEALLGRIVADLELDKELLDALMAAHDVRPDRLKTSLAWLGERLGRLKPNGSVISYSPLSRVVELEGLAVVVTLLGGSWTALEPLLPGHAAELQRAIERARRTLGELEAARPGAVAAGLAE